MDELPESLRRYPTGAAINALALRFGLPNSPFMQDWEWEVADHSRFQEWVTAYRDEPLTDDERFTLMEMLIQCVEDIGRMRQKWMTVEQSPEWHEVATLLRDRPRLHASSIAYWGLPDAGDDPEHLFFVSAAMRQVWEQIRPSLEPRRGVGE